MNKTYYMENNIYNSELNNELWEKIHQKKELTPQEKDYVSFCYHYEEFQAYGEI